MSVPLPETGRTLKQGEACAAVESVKTASDALAAARLPSVLNKGIANTLVQLNDWSSSSMIRLAAFQKEPFANASHPLSRGSQELRQWRTVEKKLCLSKHVPPVAAIIK